MTVYMPAQPALKGTVITEHANGIVRVRWQDGSVGNYYPGDLYWQFS